MTHPIITAKAQCTVNESLTFKRNSRSREWGRSMTLKIAIPSVNERPWQLKRKIIMTEAQKQIKK